jgi:hypothetical protein
MKGGEGRAGFAELQTAFEMSAAERPTPVDRPLRRFEHGRVLLQAKGVDRKEADAANPVEYAHFEVWRVSVINCFPDAAFGRRFCAELDETEDRADRFFHWAMVPLPDVLKLGKGRRFHLDLV